ncbi:MAG: preprotein translocase subunit SecG [Candidatus Zixiibacteriota bacterium]
MFIAWVVFHVIVCFALIIVVLMQSAKGEGLAGGTAFGGGVSSAVFGGRGAASFLSKATTVLAIVFFVNCGALALMSASTRVAVTGAAEEVTGESEVTRRARQEQERQLERLQRQQDAAAQDSLQRMEGQTQTINLDSLGLGLPQDTTAPSGE